MKRYRILACDFDARIFTLIQKISEEWSDEIKLLHKQNREKSEKSLTLQYGEGFIENKINNFIALGQKPFSVAAFHNYFFEQVRNSFVIGAYYPALTAACALGERILNHLLISLRDDFQNTNEYKKIYRKSSFDDWSLAISILESWEVLLPQTVIDFKLLMNKRHSALHFCPQIDQDSRQLALEAILCLQNIIGMQFSGFGSQPWFITEIPGEIYIKKQWETKPFIQKIYLPNAILVGYKNQVEAMIPQIIISDDFEYGNQYISDEEFAALRTQ